MEEFIRELRNINLLSIMVRIFLALLIGGILGLDRGRKNRAAGFRTYMLVCLGSALVMMTNQYIFDFFDASDPTRMGAQVISGIGFLGAGTILLTGRNQIKGITTAAGLWTAACCGLAIGIGFYEGALLGGLAVFSVMALMTRLDAFLHSKSRYIDLYVEFTARRVLGELVRFIRDHGCDVRDIEVLNSKEEKEGPLSAILSVASTKSLSRVEFVAMVHEVEGITFVESL